MLFRPPLAKVNTDPLSIYISSLHNALYVILNDDEAELGAYEKHFNKIEQLLDNGKDGAETIFVKSEILLHYAFVQLTFGNEISAAWMIRKSYKLVKQGMARHPTFEPILKTSAVHHIIMGSIPKKHEWLMSLFGLNGNIKEGLEQLNQLITDNSFFQNESIAITKLIGVYLFIENKSFPEPELPKNSLSHLIDALVHSKNGNNEIALSELNEIQSSSPIGFVFGLGTAMGFIVGVVIVYQVLSTDVNSHLAEYATFKAMGYRNSYLLGVVFEEALILSLLGFFPSLFIAMGAYQLTAAATALPIAMPVSRTFLVFFLTLLMCNASGAIATRRLQAADPADIF